MSSSADSAADQTHEMMKDVADHWGLIVVMGVLSVILGILAIVYPGATIVTVSIFFAAWLFVSGVGAFAHKQRRNWAIASGLLGIIAGLIVLTYPMSSAVTLALIGGIWLIVLGVMQIVAGFQLRSARNRLTSAPSAA